MKEKEIMEFTSLSLEKETITDWLDQLQIVQEFVQRHSYEVSELLDPTIDFFTDVLQNGYFQVYNLDKLRKEGDLREIEKLSQAGRA